MSTKERHLSLSLMRVAVMTYLLILFCCGVLLLVRVTPRNGWGTVIGFALGAIITPIVASPIEWLVHRYVYHRSCSFLRRIYSIHLAHHHLYFPTWRYVTGGPPRRIPILGKAVSIPQISAWKNALTYLAHFAFYMTLGTIFIWAPFWILTDDVAFLAGAVSGTIVISNLFITVHDAIHRPGSHAKMEQQSWFCFLDEHHYIHHVDTEANVNFLLPLADWLFGTFRRHLTAEEIANHGTRAAAKSKIIGVGEPATEARIGDQRAISIAAVTGS